jgi:hypothetical protein
MLESAMKMILPILLLLLIVGCATPYYPVYVSNKGDYYIAEQQTNGPYYGSNSILSNDIAAYPWWSADYPVELFAYYSPNFYPHYFSIWYPRGFLPTYGYYGGHYAYWCPPHRLRRHFGKSSPAMGLDNPIMPPVATTAMTTSNYAMRRSNDYSAFSREMTNRRTVVSKAGTSSAAIPVYGRSTRSFTPPSGHGRASARFNTPQSSRAISKTSRVIHRD